MTTGMREIKSDIPAERLSGYRRILGTLAVSAATPLAATTYRLLAGVSNQEDEDIRQLLPSYYQDTTQAARVVDGTIHHSSLSYTNPFSLSGDVVRTIWRGEDWVAGVQQGMALAVNQLIGEEIWSAAAIKALVGQDKYGQPLYTKDDTWTTTALKFTGAATGPLMPQVATRFPKQLSERPISTLRSTVIGVSSRPYDIDKQLSQKVAAWQSASNDNKARFTKHSYDLDKIPSPELLDAAHRTETTLPQAYRQSEDNLDRGFRQMKKQMDAAVRLLHDPVAVYAQMRDKGVSQELLDGLKTGIRPPTIPATLPLIDFYLRVADPPHAEALRTARSEKIGTMGGTIADSMQKLGGPLTKDDRALINRRLDDDVNELKVAGIANADIVKAMLAANARRKQPLTPQTMGRKIDLVLARLAVPTKE